MSVEFIQIAGSLLFFASATVVGVLSLTRAFCRYGREALFAVSLMIGFVGVVRLLDTPFDLLSHTTTRTVISFAPLWLITVLLQDWWLHRLMKRVGLV